MHGKNPNHLYPQDLVWDMRTIDTSEWVTMALRGGTGEEMRAQAWNAICYGAKGLIFNTSNDDAAENHGTKAEQPDSMRFDYDLNGTKPFSKMWVGNITHPITPLSFWDEFRLDRYDSGRYSNKSAWLKKDTATGTWPACVATMMNALIGTGTAGDYPTAQKIVDTFAVNCGGGLDMTGGTYGTGFRWQPFFNPDQWVGYKQAVDDADWWNRLDWPSGGLHHPIWYRVPIWYGTRSKYAGQLRIAQDVQPIAGYLHDLVWTDGFALHSRYAPDTLVSLVKDRWNKFPIMEDTGSGAIAMSQKLSVYAYPFSPDGTNDAPESSYYEVGRFVKPSDSLAIYVTIGNRRTWPIRFKYGAIQQWDSSDAAHRQALQGAKDARRFNFKVRSSVFDTSWKYFNVTDLRQNKEWIVTKDSVLHLDFEPGEGTLLRVAPALGMIAGRVSDLGMAYNNSQRVAEFDSVRKIMVWERKGTLVFNLANRPTEASMTNWIIPDSAKTIDASGRVMNPAVAAKGDTVMIIYNLASKSAGVARPVLIARNVYPCSGTWSFDTVARVAVGSGATSSHLVTPSITPAEDGFFCAWSDPSNGVVVRLIRNAGQYITKEHYVKAEPGSTMTVFPSVASQEQKDVNAVTEWLHLAVQENTDTNSHIYYKRFSHDFFSGGELDTTFQIERVSKFATSCKNHFPNIALKSGYEHYAVYVEHPPVYSGYNWNEEVRRGQPMITWQMTKDGGYCDSLNSYVSGPIVSVMYRERYENFSYSAYWGDFTSFYPKQNGFPLPLVKLGHSLRLHLMDFTDSIPSTADVKVITFQDTATKEIHLERVIGDSSKTWSHWKLIESGQYSNLTHPYIPRRITKARTFTYRGTLADTASLYSAKIVAKETGAETYIQHQLIHTFQAKDTSTCEKGLSFSVGGGSSGCPTCQEPGVDPTDSTSRISINWRPMDFSSMSIGVAAALPTPTGASVHYD
ncbi:MAG: hypothetical protein ABI444_08650, partial [Candidatus Kapaibacterium sp.]